MSVDFFDSNIFFIFDETNDHKRNVAERLIVYALRSQQRLYQFSGRCKNAQRFDTKTQTCGQTQCATFLESVLQPLWRVMPNLALYQRGLALQAR